MKSKANNKKPAAKGVSGGTGCSTRSGRTTGGTGNGPTAKSSGAAAASQAAGKKPKKDIETRMGWKVNYVPSAEELEEHFDTYYSGNNSDPKATKGSFQMRLLRLTQECNLMITKAEAFEEMAKGFQESKKEIEIKLGLRLPERCSYFETPADFMSSAHHKMVKNKVSEFVLKKVWIKLVLRFLNEDTEETWVEIVDWCLRDWLGVKCSIFVADVFKYVDKLMRQSLRALFSAVNTKYRRRLSVLLSK